MRYARDPNPAHNAIFPICNKEMDGAIHILAGCQGKHMKVVYINRHNRAEQYVLSKKQSPKRQMATTT